MSSYIEIDNDTLLDEFMNRVHWWVPNHDWEYQLFEEYYRNCISAGEFDGINLDDIMAIVDNDYVNILKCFRSRDDADNDLNNFDDRKIVAELYEGEILVELT